MATKEELADEWNIAPTSKMLSYGFGYVVVNYFLYYGLAPLFYFYEVEIGLNVILIGIAFVIFAIWNMINDPLLGYLTERPRKWSRKFGVRAPWIVISTGPMLFLYLFIWMPIPFGGAMVIFLYFIIVTCMFDLFFSIYNDHVYGGFTNQFPTEYERRRAFAIATLIVGVTLTFLSILGSLIIEYGRPETFFFLSVVVVAILIVFNLILFLGLRESEGMKDMLINGYENAEDKSFFQVMKVSLKRKNFVISVMGYTVQITAMGLWSAGALYYYKDVLGLDYSASILPSIIMLATFLGFIPFWSNFARKHGFKKTYCICFFFHGLSFVPFLFITTIEMVWIFSFFQGIFYGGEISMLMPVASDTCDDISIHLGRRQDGTLQGIRTFFFRIAIIVVGVVFTVVSITTGYNTTPNATQSPLAIWGIRVKTALIPAILYMVVALIFYKFYDLEGEKKAEIMRKVKEMGLTRY